MQEKGGEERKLALSEVLQGWSNANLNNSESSGGISKTYASLSLLCATWKAHNNRVYRIHFVYYLYIMENIMFYIWYVYFEDLSGI